jgi:hypothetical protein
MHFRQWKRRDLITLIGDAGAAASDTGDRILGRKRAGSAPPSDSKTDVVIGITRSCICGGARYPPADSEGLGGALIGLL